MKQQAEQHSQLGLYVPAKWLHDGILAVNSFLHDKSIPMQQALSAGRLLVGGQGLRAGDPKRVPVVTADNACVACLAAGNRVPETLKHVLFDCPTFGHLRRQEDISALLPDLRDGICLHRNVWQWRQLRCIIRFLDAVGTERARQGNNKQVAIDAARLWNDENIALRGVYTDR